MVPTETMAKVNFQSNSIRDDFLKQIMDRTINEILASVSSLLGPGATDAYIIRENQAYYTRDGKEVCQSIIFDNEIANYVHHILYQAVYNQGHNIGDGSTTLAVLYCYIYKLMREEPSYQQFINTHNINEARAIWKTVVDKAIAGLKEKAVPLNDELLLSMLYTCTQDADLTGKIFHELREPIMAGAYIIPRKSNINTDFHVTVHNRPVYRVTTHFSIREFAPVATVKKADGKKENKPGPSEAEYNVVYFCNGPIDIAHSELIAAMSMAGIPDPYKPGDPNAIVFPNIILLGTGITEATRRSIREYSNFMKNVEINQAATANVIIMTLDDSRAMSQDEIEDIATVVGDFPGLSGMNQSITFEAYLYNVFLDDDAKKSLHIDPIPELESFDADPSLVKQMKMNFVHPYRIIYDEVDGIALDKEMNGFARQRYEALRKAIDEEKSPVKRVDLNKRLRRSFGMFIDLEIGSVLLKDSQRKFELILDAIISTAEAATDGVVIGNSMIHAAEVIEALQSEHIPACILMDALGETVNLLVHNAYPKTTWMPDTLETFSNTPERRAADFNLLNDDIIWPTIDNVAPIEPIHVTGEGEDGESYEYDINPMVVESYNAIKAILENSSLPMELAYTKQITLSGRQGLMGNYVD